MIHTISKVHIEYREWKSIDMLVSQHFLFYFLSYIDAKNTLQLYIWPDFKLWKWWLRSEYWTANESMSGSVHEIVVHIMQN